MGMKAKGMEPAGKKANYTPGDVPVIKEAHSKEESFKRGGRMKRKSGGALGSAPAARLDRKSGGGVMSKASKVSMRPGFAEGSPHGKEDD